LPSEIERAGVRGLALVPLFSYCKSSSSVCTTKMIIQCVCRGLAEAHEISFGESNGTFLVGTDGGQKPTILPAGSDCVFDKRCWTHVECSALFLSLCRVGSALRPGTCMTVLVFDVYHDPSCYCTTNHHHAWVKSVRVLLVLALIVGIFLLPALSAHASLVCSVRSAFVLWWCHFHLHI